MNEFLRSQLEREYAAEVAHRRRKANIELAILLVCWILFGVVAMVIGSVALRSLLGS